MGKLSRTKGANFERLMAAKLRTLAPSVTAERCLVETREGNSGDILTNLPMAIQCKVGASPPIYRAIDEAIEVAEPGQMAVAFIARNQTKKTPRYDLTVLPTEHFLKLIRMCLNAGLLHSYPLS